MKTKKNGTKGSCTEGPRVLGEEGSILFRMVGEGLEHSPSTQKAEGFLSPGGKAVGLN